LEGKVKRRGFYVCATTNHFIRKQEQARWFLPFTVCGGYTDCESSPRESTWNVKSRSTGFDWCPRKETRPTWFTM